MCDKTSRHVPNVVSAMFETNTHGQWDSVTFMAEGLDHPKKEIIQKDVASENYLPAGFPTCIEQQNAACSFYKKKQPSKVQMSSDYMQAYHDNLKMFTQYSNGEDDVIFKFICFFCSPQFRNAAILSHYGNEKCKLSHHYFYWISTIFSCSK